MTTIFENILRMSAVAAVAIAIILVLRLLLKKAPKVISYALWAIVLIRLLCPFFLESSPSPVLPRNSAKSLPFLLLSSIPMKRDFKTQLMVERRFIPMIMARAM